jgi:hypothetical protein
MDNYDDYDMDYDQPQPHGLRVPNNSMLNDYDAVRFRRGGASDYDESYSYNVRAPRAFTRDINMYEPPLPPPHQTFMHPPRVFNPPVPTRVDYHVQPVMHKVVTPKVNTYVRNHVTKVIQPVVSHVVTPQVNNVVHHHVQPVSDFFFKNNLLKFIYSGVM